MTYQLHSRWPLRLKRRMCTVGTSRECPCAGTVLARLLDSPVFGGPDVDLAGDIGAVLLGSKASLEAFHGSETLVDVNARIVIRASNTATRPWEFRLE